MSKIVDKLTASTDTAGTTRDTIIATDGAGSDQYDNSLVEDVKPYTPLGGETDLRPWVAEFGEDTGVFLYSYVDGLSLGTMGWLVKTFFPEAYDEHIKPVLDANPAAAVSGDVASYLSPGLVLRLFKGIAKSGLWVAGKIGKLSAAGYKAIGKRQFDELAAAMTKHGGPGAAKNIDEYLKTIADEVGTTPDVIEDVLKKVNFRFTPDGVVKLTRALPDAVMEMKSITGKFKSAIKTTTTAVKAADKGEKVSKVVGGAIDALGGGTVWEAVVVGLVAARVAYFKDGASPDEALQVAILAGGSYYAAHHAIGGLAGFSKLLQRILRPTGDTWGPALMRALWNRIGSIVGFNLVFDTGVEDWIFEKIDNLNHGGLVAMDPIKKAQMTAKMYRGGGLVVY